MRKWLLYILFASTLLGPASAGAQSPPGPWTQVGGLSCKLAPTISLIVLSEQKMACEFKPNQPGWPVQRYAGTMTNVGIDLGAIAGGPAGAAAGLALQGLLHDQLGEATQVQYTITGSWDQPSIEPILKAERAGEPVVDGP